MAQALPTPLEVELAAGQPARRRFASAGAFVRREPLGVLGAVLILVVVFCAIAAPLLTSRDPQKFSSAVLKQPSAEHFFGTTREGKDVYARVLYGARVVGASELRIMLRHMLPNLAGLMIIITSTTLPAAILTESSLSFLGVGVEVGTPSWGRT